VLRLPRPPTLSRLGIEPFVEQMPLTALALRRLRPDVAHALYPTDALVAARSGAPTVFTELGLPERGYLSKARLRGRIHPNAARRAAVVVALSRAAAEGAASTYGVEARVIHPAVDLETFRPHGERAPVPTLVCAADMGESRKRVDLLLEAFPRVRDRRPDVRLVLSRPSRAPGPLPSGVELHDLDDTAHLARAYREAWVSVLPSVGEAFGLVLAEAMACGTPGVGTRNGGIPEVVDDPSVGRLFEGGPDDLARALLEALELAVDPGTERACRARAERLSRGQAADTYERLYAEIA
jgi:glycosyltransferase involved in cell wall biosynthesis